MVSSEENAAEDPTRAFLQAMLAAATRHAATVDQLIAVSRTNRTQIICDRCNGPHLGDGADPEPERECACALRCEQPGCPAPPADEPMIIPDYPFP